MQIKIFPFPICTGMKLIQFLAKMTIYYSCNNKNEGKLLFYRELFFLYC